MTDADQVLRALEHELHASAAGYPAAQDDLTTYLQFEILQGELAKNQTKMLYHLFDIFGCKREITNG